uniref:Uncharacterized protein n=1 Tax=Anguilla anguilla TaxID=7936 RepID=A0A0E9VVJ1_ANGAN
MKLSICGKVQSVIFNFEVFTSISGEPCRNSAPFINNYPILGGRK